MLASRVGTQNFIALSTVVAACGGTTEPVESSPPRAAIERVADMANNANGSDLFVSVVPAADERAVSEYRISFTYWWSC